MAAVSNICCSATAAVRCSRTSTARCIPPPYATASATASVIASCLNTKRHLRHSSTFFPPGATPFKRTSAPTPLAARSRQSTYQRTTCSAYTRTRPALTHAPCVPARRPPPKRQPVQRTTAPSTGLLRSARRPRQPTAFIVWKTYYAARCPPARRSAQGAERAASRCKREPEPAKPPSLSHRA